jgi:hypothetical protein
MSKKKSYMNKENIIAEGFFSKLKSIFKLSPDKVKKIKKDKKVKKSVKQLNKNWSDLSDMFAKDYGIKPKFEKFKVSDFM